MPGADDPSGAGPGPDDDVANLVAARFRRKPPTVVDEPVPAAESSASAPSASELREAESGELKSSEDEPAAEPAQRPVSAAAPAAEPAQRPVEDWSAMSRHASRPAEAVVVRPEPDPVEPPPTVPVAEVPDASPPTLPDASTAIVGRERFLPLTGPTLIAPTEQGPMRIFAPVGTVVHAVEGGRVSETDGHIAGEVIVRVDGDRFYRYRRLLPSSVCVGAGEQIRPGAVIGTVAPSIDAEHPCLVVGLQGGDGDWLDVYDALVGLADPAELGLRISNNGPAEWVDPLGADQVKSPPGPDTAPAPARGASPASSAPQGPTTDDVASLVATRVRRSR